MDYDAERAIVLLLAVLRGHKQGDVGLMPHTVCGFRHLRTCPHGQWLSPKSPRPHGDPCSERCLLAQEAVEAGMAWLMANERPEPDRQVSIFEGVAG